MPEGMNRKEHWERVYRDKAADQVSWYQADPAVSLRLIREALPDPAGAIIDVGGGASTLAGLLVDAGYRRVSVVDLSGAALAAARVRMGPAADSVDWIEADALALPLSPGAFDLWHDRAVFHFLTSPADRRGYVAQVTRTLKPGGLVLIATFAPDGPLRCSGLDTVRYGPESLQAELGPDFSLLKHVREEHLTPDGRVQPFTYCLFGGRRAPEPRVSL